MSRVAVAATFAVAAEAALAVEPPPLTSGTNPLETRSARPAAEAAPRNPQTPGEDGDDPMKTFRAPLLREGSTLMEAQARLVRSESQNAWTIIVERAGNNAPSLPTASIAGASSTPKHELIVLPCTRLTEMERIIESAAARNGHADMLFEVSGRVYVFRDHNYFLPTHAVVISAASSKPTASTPVAASAPESGEQSIAASSPADDDSAESIARSLELAAGPLARSSAGSMASSAPPAERSGTGSKASTASRDVAHSDSQSVLQENTAIVNRRGRVVRDRSGGWLLVFDADATGLADPPLKLLPCMLLENIEDYARRVGNNSSVIITGQVYVYDGQNYLLPTVYRIPRERSRLTP